MEKGERAQTAVLTADPAKKASPNGKKQWQKPRLEDVSSRVMAQPYIRFT